MSDTKFTPGPWEWWDEDDRVRVTEAAEQKFICEVTLPSNAHLIASAPALYEALEIIASIGAVDASNTAIVVGHDANVVLQQAYAALRQARGEA